LIISANILPVIAWIRFWAESFLSTEKVCEEKSNKNDWPKEVKHDVCPQVVWDLGLKHIVVHNDYVSNNVTFSEEQLDAFPEEPPLERNHFNDPPNELEEYPEHIEWQKQKYVDKSIFLEHEVEWRNYRDKVVPLSEKESFEGNFSKHQLDQEPNEIKRCQSVHCEESENQNWLQKELIPRKLRDVGPSNIHWVV